MPFNKINVNKIEDGDLEVHQIDYIGKHIVVYDYLYTYL